MIILSLLVYQACCKQIINTQTELYGFYIIPSGGEQVITIWLRPQTQFLQFLNITPPCIFMILSGVNGQNITIFKYIPLDDRKIQIQIENYQEYQTMSVRAQLLNLNYAWMNIYITLSQNNLIRVQIQEQSLEIINSRMKSKYLYSWQNITYTCLIYDQYQEQLNDITLLIIQSNSIFIQLLQDIYNYRNQIQIKIYCQYKMKVLNVQLLRIKDQLGYLDIYQNNNNKNINFLYYNRKGENIQVVNLPQNYNNSIYWYSIELVFGTYQISFQIEYFNEILQGVIYSTFDYMTEENQENVIFQQSIWISPDMKNYKIYVINKSFDYISFTYENLCYKNCKYCEKLLCLECEGNLTTETYCQCLLNQEFNKELGTCVDKTFYFQINQLDSIPNCEIGYYLNSITNQCQLCPKLNEYTCTECIYQTDQWIMDGLCRFQEFSQEQFIEQYAIEIILSKKLYSWLYIQHEYIYIKMNIIQNFIQLSIHFLIFYHLNYQLHGMVQRLLYLSVEYFLKLIINRKWYGLSVSYQLLSSFLQKSAIKYNEEVNFPQFQVLIIFLNQKKQIFDLEKQY